jgi:hypothetical protein
MPDAGPKDIVEMVTKRFPEQDINQNTASATASKLRGLATKGNGNGKPPAKPGRKGKTMAVAGHVVGNGAVSGDAAIILTGKILAAYPALKGEGANLLALINGR